VVSKTGSAEVSTDPHGGGYERRLNRAQTRKEWKTARYERRAHRGLLQGIGQGAGMFYAFSQPIEMCCSIASSRGSVRCAVKIYGDDYSVAGKRRGSGGGPLGVRGREGRQGRDLVRFRS
jgi:Cu/Ag efflux pump CusA